jgi:hypothetical protein
MAQVQFQPGWLIEEGRKVSAQSAEVSKLRASPSQPTTEAQKHAKPVEKSSPRKKL